MALPIVAVDPVAVLLAAVISYVIGFAWYGPIFGKTWMKLMKIFVYAELLQDHETREHVV